MGEVIWFEEVAALKTKTKVIRKRRFYKSKLDKHHDALIELNKAGASKSEIQRWLETKKTKVVWTTVHRWLEKHG
jgi:hypothetical protein